MFFNFGRCVRLLRVYVQQFHAAALIFEVAHSAVFARRPAAAGRRHILRTVHMRGRVRIQTPNRHAFPFRVRMHI